MEFMGFDIASGNNPLVEASYDDVMNLFNKMDTGICMIGGAWCNNCTAIINELVDSLNELNVNKCLVYNPRFINVFKEISDLRQCKTLEIKLKYYELIERLGFKSKELVTDTLIPKLRVPFFFVVKNGTCIDYYSIELVKDNGYLHLEDDDVDKTMEFKENIKRLISLI